MVCTPILAPLAAPRLQHPHRKLNFHRVEIGGVEQLVADGGVAYVDDVGSAANPTSAAGTTAGADARTASAHAIVEPVDDHRAVIGCGEHKGKLASDVAHETSPERTSGHANTRTATAPRERITCHSVIPPTVLYRLRGQIVQIARCGRSGTDRNAAAFSSGSIAGAFR
jgi:hypothetical protein